MIIHVGSGIVANMNGMCAACVLRECQVVSSAENLTAGDVVSYTTNFGIFNKAISVIGAYSIRDIELKE